MSDSIAENYSAKCKRHGQMLLENLRFLYDYDADSLWLIHAFESTVDDCYSELAHTLQLQRTCDPLRHLIAILCRDTIPAYDGRILAGDDTYRNEIAEYLNQVNSDGWAWQPTWLKWREPHLDDWEVTCVKLPIPLTQNSYTILKLF
jgi:hypothetical protein